MIDLNRLLARRYRLIEQIAEGGSAYIFKAIDERTKQEVAIKILKPELLNDPEFVQRFKKEVHASLKLRHANIVHAHDAGLDLSMYYIVMELVPGETLKHLIRSHGALPIKYVVSVAKKLCLALEYAHAKGFVHRDIKPQNVLLDSNGEPYIVDFGIARNVAHNTISVEDTSVMGSVHYFSPEQARGERVDKRSDIYSLGILIYEMLTGHVPFDADTSIAIALKHINDPLPDIQTEKETVPESLKRIIQKATEKDKHFRYKSTFNMYEDLQRCFTEPDGEYVKYTESKRVKQHKEEQMMKRSKHSLKRLFAILGVAAAGVVVITLLVSGFIDYRLQQEPKMPNILGLTEENAAEVAAQASLQPVFEYRYSAQTSEGIVIEQDPQPDAAIIENEPVTIVVSNGTATDIMPDVTNMDISAAQEVLEENGIELNQIVSDINGDLPLNYVIDQYPKPGDSISASGSVWLTVKASPDVNKANVPGVEGSMLENAVATLTANGFSMFFVNARESDQPAGTVISQSPQPDFELAVNKPVALTISELEGQHYRLKDESMQLTVPNDGTKLKIGMPIHADTHSLYYVIFDTIVPAGTQTLDLRNAASILIDSEEDEIMVELDIFMNDIYLKSEPFLFVRED